MASRFGQRPSVPDASALCGDERLYAALRSRLDLALATQRRERALSVLAVRIRQRIAGGTLGTPTPALEDELVGALRAVLSPGVDTLAVTAPGSLAILMEREEAGAFAVHAADRIIEAIASFGENAGVEMVGSVGVSSYPADGDTIQTLLGGAEAAAEGAELSGGGFVAFSSRAADESAARRALVERALVGAIDRKEYTLHYQPQLDSRDGSLVGVEALLRYRNNKLGAVSPAEFIPVLEQTGQIGHVGAWVVHEACEQAARWEREGAPVRVGVNVSAVQFKTRTFAEDVANALAETRLTPSLLELELTEGILVENPTDTRLMLDDFRKRGVRVAVDDFGTGYASLAYVRQFPMDTLKIDRQFVRGLPLDNESAAITAAIVALARSLRLELVAEGVEHEAAEEFLHSLDCYVIQGFLHARPMPENELSAWRKARPWA